MELISLHNVNAGYDGKVILHNVNLTISATDFIGVIGPNGGGKTTLLKVLLGILKPYSGSVEYAEVKRNLFGYLPQNQTFDKNFPITVKEIVLSGLMSHKGIFGRYSAADKCKASELLEKYGLHEYENKAVGELSGGQAQRALLCRAVISDPKILVLDEPATYVDSGFEKELYSILDTLNEKMAIVMVSHDLGTVCSYVKSIACVNKYVHFHNSNKITDEELRAYDCPIELLCHGDVPHRVLHSHDAPHSERCGCQK